MRSVAVGIQTSNLPWANALNDRATAAAKCLLERIIYVHCIYILRLSLNNTMHINKYILYSYEIHLGQEGNRVRIGPQYTLLVQHC